LYREGNLGIVAYRTRRYDNSTKTGDENLMGNRWPKNSKIPSYSQSKAREDFSFRISGEDVTISKIYSTAKTALWLSFVSLIVIIVHMIWK